MYVLRNGIFQGLLWALACLGLTAGHLRAQQTTRTWSDGQPTFTSPYTSTAVRVDSVVELEFTAAIDSEPDTFSLHLTGIDKIYNTANQAILTPEDFRRLPDANLYIIADAFARRVFVIRPQDGVEVAEFRGDPNTPEALERPVAAQAYLDSNNVRKVLITDQGSHRVLRFDYDTRVLEWVYGTGSQGSGAGLLSEPSSAVYADSARVLICDTGNNRLLLIDTGTRSILWEWGQGTLKSPVDAEWRGNSVLVTDRGNHRVVLVDRRTNTITWQFGTGTPQLSDTTLSAPEDAQMLADSTVLIADAGNKRVIQVDQTGQIVWRFLGQLPSLKSVYRLTEGRTLVISENLPKRLGYSTQIFVSQIHDLGRAANYDSIRWQVIQPTGTSVRFQLRSANSLGDLGGAQWLGPDGPGTYYTTESQTISLLHDGHRFYQYQAELSTSDFLQTPILDQVQINHHFFDVNTNGIFTTPVITDSAGLIITNWESLVFHTIIPTVATQRDEIELEVRILDAGTNATLQSYLANNASVENVFNLRQIEKLRAVQAIRLQAILRTNNSSVSPMLADWTITWQNTTSAPASINFTTDAGVATRVVRTKLAANAGQNPPKVVFVTMRDQNLTQVQNGAQVELTSKKSGDRQAVTLELRPSGEYRLTTGLPAVISDFIVPDNGLLELFDRDTLRVRYVDPTTPTDIALDSALVLQLTSGTLQIETRLGPFSPTDKVTFTDTLFLHLSGEQDRNFSGARDTVFATLFDNITNDVEDIMLLENPDQPGGSTYATGDFRSIVGIPLAQNSVGARNDRRLQTRPGNQIGARYLDNDTSTVSLQVEPDTTGGPGPVTGTGAFSFLLAPNPYLAGRGTTMRLRMEAYTGDLVLRKVEIYNIAGERVRTIAASQLNMDRGVSISAAVRSTTRSQWWDLRTETGDLAGSGTYWAKFYCRFTDATGQQQDATFMRKFVLVQ